MTKGGKGSGFSGGGTVADKARAYAEAKAKGAILTDEVRYDIENLPSFIRDKMEQSEVHAVLASDSVVSVKRETEKAVLVNYEMDFGNVRTWVPKSVLLTQEKYEAQLRKDYEREYVNNSYNDYLRTTAKSAGVKLGSTRKWAKVQDKLTKAGVKWLSRDDYANTKA